MSIEEESDPKFVVAGILAAFVAIGIFGVGQTNDAGVAVTWFWLGLGLSVTYVLYRILLALERIAVHH